MAGNRVHENGIGLNRGKDHNIRDVLLSCFVHAHPLQDTKGGEKDKDREEEGTDGIDDGKLVIHPA